AQSILSGKKESTTDLFDVVSDDLLTLNKNLQSKITFESGQFTLQEFGYEGCVILSEIEGLVKFLLLNKLDESDLGHMIWLKEYQYHEVATLKEQLQRERELRKVLETGLMMSKKILPLLESIDDTWGGISSLEHDEAVMLEAAMFGGITEESGYLIPYAPRQYMRNGLDENLGVYARPTPHPPSLSLIAQRSIREQQKKSRLRSVSDSLSDYTQFTIEQGTMSNKFCYLDVHPGTESLSKKSKNDEAQANGK
ncbi:hypothetical protein Tco_1114352, partial [Tanacetum coccineum]